MPGYQAHLAAGTVLGGAAAAGLVYFGYYDLSQWPLLVGLLAVCLLGSLFPDIDTNSRGQNLFYGGLLVADLFFLVKGMYKWAAYLGFFAIMPGIGPHRGWTHTWWAMLVVPAPILLIPAAVSLPQTYFLAQIDPALPWQDLLPFYLSFVLGYFSHLLLDREFF